MPGARHSHYGARPEVPLRELAGTMMRLAAGDTTSRVPPNPAKDDIGDMARTVIVFRDTMIERERLAAEQATANREREDRGEVIAATITRFELQVVQADLREVLAFDAPPDEQAQWKLFHHFGAALRA